MDEQSLLRSLAGLPVSRVAFFSTVASTNDVALAWLEGDVADGALAAADTQTAGRGRLARRWVTEPGAALAFSLALRPTPAETGRLGLFPALGALAVCQALEEECGIAASIKWPNDVLVAGRKLCGILPEAVWQGAVLRGLCLGIGLNVLAAAVPPAEALLFPATSLEEAGCTPQREALLRAVLAALFAWRARIHTSAFLDALNTRMAYRDQPVQIEQAGGAPLTGVALGFAPDGALRLRTSNNEEMLVSAGDVRLRPLDASPSQPGGR